MSNALFALLGSLAPVQGLLKRFGAAAARLPRTPAASALDARQAALQVSASTAAPACASRSRIGARAGTHVKGGASMPLRVVRVVDTSHASHSGRMVISGRMADVCAELDRMVERESSLRLGV